MPALRVVLGGASPRMPDVKAHRMQCHLDVSNIAWAARALSSEPLADVPDLVVIAVLRVRYPEAASAKACVAVTLQGDSAVLSQALRRLAAKRGTAIGINWAYDDTWQMASASAEADEATLEVVNVILSGDVSQHITLLKHAFTGLQRPDGDGARLRSARCGTVWLPFAPWRPTPAVSRSLCSFAWAQQGASRWLVTCCCPLQRRTTMYKEIVIATGPGIGHGPP